ncbi:M15 family metallopeptidase [Myxococcota bacterium]|nr:M15 family metallopeptidase [Myxococcota bacterium]
MSIIFVALLVLSMCTGPQGKNRGQKRSAATVASPGKNLSEPVRHAPGKVITVRPSHQDPVVPIGLRCIKRAYPQVRSIDAHGLTLISGERFIWDRGRDHMSLKRRLEDPDLKTMMSQCYSPGRHGTPPLVNHDPGRARVESFFRAIYGKRSSSVIKHLKSVTPPVGKAGIRVRVSSINAIDERLARIFGGLTAPKMKFRALFTGSAGYHWRTVAGTARLSAHSFGIAIDINPKYGDYWRWDRGADVYKNRVPVEIVTAFEGEGFIWGGKWYHYDTMHFEYRPELLDPECICPVVPDNPAL